MHTSLKRVGLSLALALPLVGGIGAVDSAQADTEDCVTRQEFGLVKSEWTKERVHRVFDVLGRQASYYDGYGKYQSREYRSCVDPRYSYLNMDYVWRKSDHTWRVDGKSAYWG